MLFLVDYNISCYNLVDYYLTNLAGRVIYMLKKLLSLAIALGLAFSILLPSTFMYADDEDDDAETEEEADAEESNDDEEDAEEDATVADEVEEAESTAQASDEPEDLTIYFYVIGFVVILIVGMYAFTECMRKK